MHALPAPTPIRRPRYRTLTIIAERPYGHHERLEVPVIPGMAVTDLPFDERHFTLVQPGGAVLAAGDDLFEISADTPRLFALHHEPQRDPRPISCWQRLPVLARLLGGARRAATAIIVSPKSRHGVAP